MQRINEAVCNASRPPVYNKTPEIVAIKTPHTNFDKMVGFKDPFVVILAIIKVAESAEVIKIL